MFKKASTEGILAKVFLLHCFLMAQLMPSFQALYWYFL